MLLPELVNVLKSKSDSLHSIYLNCGAVYCMVVQDSLVSLCSLNYEVNTLQLTNLNVSQPQFPVLPCRFSFWFGIGNESATFRTRISFFYCFHFLWPFSIFYCFCCFWYTECFWIRVQNLRTDYTLCSIQYIWVSPNTPTIRRKGWREATLTPPWGPPMKSLKIKQFGTVGILKLCDSMHVEPNQRHGEKLMMHWVKVKTWNANDA